LNVDGSFDSSFGTAGVAILAGNASAVAIASNGKILVTSSNFGFSGMLARYNTNGSLDNGFGVFGRAASVATASALAVQRDGKIVVAGTVTDLVGQSSDSDFALIRFNAAGALTRPSARAAEHWQISLRSPPTRALLAWRCRPMAASSRRDPQRPGPTLLNSPSRASPVRACWTPLSARAAR
jgi:uncharacterized delta-60 repeat protein